MRNRSHMPHDSTDLENVYQQENDNMNHPLTDLGLTILVWVAIIWLLRLLIKIVFGR